MATAKLTMITLQKWMLSNNDDLFANMVLPEGVDKDVLTGNFLLRGGEFEVMYPDPEFLKDAITLWSKKWYRTFDKWVYALSLEYNPIENYDRQESWTDTSNKGSKNSGRRDSGNTRTFDNQDKRTLDTEDKRTLDTTNERTLDTQDQRTNDTTEEKTLDTENKRTLDTTTTMEETVSAYDSSSYQPSRKEVTEQDGTDTMDNTGTETITNTGTITDDHTGTDTTTNTGTDTLTSTGTDTVDYSGTIKDEYGEGYSGESIDNGKTIHSGRIHGNVGVTTSQQMLESELELAKWNLYEHITDIFLEEFVIPIYI